MLLDRTRKLAKKLGLLKSAAVHVQLTEEQEIHVNERIGMIRERLRETFEFLSKHTRHNRQVQLTAYREWLLPYPDDTAGKLKSILQHIWNTQSQPKMDTVLPTWASFHDNRKVFSGVQTMDDLATAISHLVPEGACPNVEADGAYPLDKIWFCLNETAGFGKKTAALFVKAVVDIHTLDKCEDIRFLNNFEIRKGESIRIPVDTVIIEIFRKITGVRLSFSDINDLIFDDLNYNAMSATTWDELWFWGFITQRNVNGAREFEVNEAKFWSILGAPWGDWDVIAPLAKEFLELTGPLMPQEV